ncbi:putative zinc finger protein R05D3.3, partial [Clarias magur]
LPSNPIRASFSPTAPSPPPLSPLQDLISFISPYSLSHALQRGPGILLHCFSQRTMSGILSCDPPLPSPTISR